MRPKIKTGREKTASARMDQALTDRFKWALESQHISMASALKQMIMAYCKLAEKLNGTPILTLEFKGVDERSAHINYPTSLSLRRTVAQRREDCREISKTELARK